MASDVSDGAQTLPPHEVSASLKFLLLIFAIALIVSLGSLVWNFKNSPDLTDYSAPHIPSQELAEKTADWKTYENTLLGFAVKYPPTDSAQVSPQSTATNAAISFKAGLSTASIGLTINVETTTKTLSQVTSTLKTSGILADERLVKLGGVSAFEGIHLGSTFDYEVYTVKNGKLYTLVFYGKGLDETIEAKKAALTQEQQLILASFRYSK